MGDRNRQIVLINPWIYDFAAYDLWAKPLGLLYLGSIMRESGYEVRLIDCMDRHDPLLRASTGCDPKVRKYGVGPYHRTPIPKPSVLRHVPRQYARYGITEEHFQAYLREGERPDLVLITSMMTYWYPGVFRAIELVKGQWPSVPVILGGIYATLCYDHARERSGADEVVRGGEIQDILKVIEDVLGGRSQVVPEHFRDFPTPAWDLYPKLSYTVILTGRGCPFRCTFCASSLLFPRFERRDPVACVDEVVRLVRARRIQDIAFYDDALLIHPEQHILPLLDEVIGRRLNVRFHTPNGLHVREINRALTQKMWKAGFRTVRLSVESSDPERQRATGAKITNTDLQDAVEHLRTAGYRGKDLEAYVLMGLPGQTVDEVVASVLFVTRCGIKTKLARFSPIPGTVEWDRASAQGGLDPRDDPLLHNNSIYPLRSSDLTVEDMEQVSLFVRLINYGLDMGFNPMDDSRVSAVLRKRMA